MSLTKSQWVTIWLGIGVVILGAISTVLIREWYQPDIRYEEGSWYRTNEFATGSLKLDNLGHSDAEDVQIVAHFSEPITDIAIVDPSVTFKVITGGVAKKEVCGIISRIVPDETIYVYFSTKNPSLSNLPSSFISNIKFKGGKGKTGKPLLPLFLWCLLGLIVGSPIGILTGYRFGSRSGEKTVSIHNEEIRKGIQLGIDSVNEGLTEKQLVEKIKEGLGEEVFYRKPIFCLAARSSYDIFKGIKETKSGLN